ncbi:alcohol dehydrogenase catalytic domain-containing protein [Planosporangium flavigriseum]|uniref:Putative alcohol dehydrogenase adh n=1 Tax=Planosporangium flavigriseum TaxID=373681 RepID=A0A8J3LSI8_9ACTN|nr:alcohol dehydrogenase catalytic domain-containing protein [Planosporangium flavigriseum]NJC67748.1 alcohol dehydrogenase catalytic domain-containing protein [Planosporangium flavigriseum]GIG76025.1 putative alcohol dehydrogenase adh [Planosporangium flavigriseum]
MRDSTALASVALPGSKTELREFALPACDTDSGWLRVEASGICGTDVGLHSAGLPSPTVLGHHVYGQIAEIGDEAARRWAVRPGDWVVIEEYLPCGHCDRCADGRYRLCPRTDMWGEGRRVGLIAIDEAPALWGGNGQYMYLPPQAVVHPLPGGVDTGRAAWALPLANALDWVLGAGALSSGETVVVLGPGYHGLAAVAAAHHGDAGNVVVCGLPRDRSRLDIAAAMGATTVESSGDDLRERVVDATGGRMADVVLDLTGAGADSVTRAVSLLAQSGRLVLAGGKGSTAATLNTSELTRLTATVRGVRGRAPERVRQSIHLLADGVGPELDKVPTVEVPLAGVGEMLDRLAAGTGPDSPHVVVRPWAE